MRSFGVYKGGNSENAPFVVFASFCAQKEDKLSCPLGKRNFVFVSFKMLERNPAPFCAQKEESIPPRGDADTP